ncbi:patatin-like phospholipase family protein [Psychroflexus sp. YR1-1]|uniref:Patatin-like phospholipase family protein n=1 Tax=Psychroflexus aurantiacus TaxID=2709310 RepID=A0A6B3R3G2_9FLAO|nr:patatin-like phospholipase family protein [Psychroflexus aurantiacus]NEV94993.1 patatin-like phospholipase family protein [Psychroflexus aurantiacus]
MNIGLVLSGGGMRGAAHIGVIKALEEHGIFPTHISGASAGAIVGALYAYGYDWETMFKFFKTFQLLDFKKYALGKPGIIDAEKFYPQFSALLKDDNFSALKKSLTITATDILKGNLKTFSEGELIKPILASAAFPGFFAPVKIEDSFYIDGGVLNNFPISVLKPKCDIIIGSYVNGYDAISIKDLKHFHNVVERTFKLKSVKEDYKKFKHCDLVIVPKALGKYGTFDKKYLNDIFNIGYSATIKALKNDISLKLKFPNKFAQN